MEQKDKNLIIDGGAVWFGLVIGWITAVTFYSTQGHTSKELAAIVAVITGAAISKLFSKTDTQFSMYCVGLALGFIIQVVLIACYGKIWPVLAH
ncbi:hypothetical protein MUN81_09415 [Hymenobacter sp. 5317J-9]|uniref:hypothetical protein n=1 Tax=Hymenobacter sp. 5317J-9 TaxID=2932250 RepID=UPI001FD6513B|nr:hypothetical protein [Hymenobacter sp. 5317J-9]UOQ99696.1 hypothetical protein MUN81_09415 [Hymenobacter sp. 5317J-9]